MELTHFFQFYLNFLLLNDLKDILLFHKFIIDVFDTFRPIENRVRTTTEPSTTATTEEIVSSTFYDTTDVVTITTTEPVEIATTEQNDENNTIS